VQRFGILYILLIQIKGGKRMTKRLISMLLSVALVMTSADTNVFATEQSTENVSITETQEMDESEEEKEGGQEEASSNEEEMESGIDSEMKTNPNTDQTIENETESEVLISSESEKETQIEKTELESIEISETETVTIKETESASEEGNERREEIETVDSETELQELLGAEGNIASGVIDEDYGHITWVIDANGKLTVQGTGDFSRESSYKAPWYSKREFITSAVISVTDMTNASGLFSECSNLTNLDLSSFDTENIIDMGDMFFECSSLTNLDLSGFNTAKVTNMSGMFMFCSSLRDLDLSSFDTSNVTNMGFMFSECSNLINLNVSSFDTRSTMNIERMFSECSNLTNLNVSSFDTRNVTDMNGMFHNCRKLISLDLRKFDTTNIIDMSWMFHGCNSLTSLNVSNFNTKNVTDMREMFGGCYNLTSLDVSSFDTKNVIDMNGMFGGCYNLTSLDVSSFDTKNVIDMNSMFASCYNLTSLDVSSFDTANVTDMQSMFAGCNSLIRLDLSSFDTGKVTDMRYMFRGCHNLISLDVGSFNTKKVINMRYMFSECGKLTSLNVSSFNTGNVTDMQAMFCLCSALISLNVSSFDTRKVIDMGGMFEFCSSLESLDVSSFDAQNAITMDRMFEDSALKTLYTPKNVTQPVTLPTSSSTDKWYCSDGTIVTELPQNLSYSVVLEKNEIPTGNENTKPSHISATKSQTEYEYGDVLYTNDLAVILCYNDGTSKEITNYSTNADNIDMLTIGTKVLTISYRELTTTIDLKVNPRMLDARTAVVLPYTSCKYDGTAKEPIPSSVIANGRRLIRGIDYTVSWSDNVNVGDAAVHIIGQNNYQGRLTCKFTILEKGSFEEPSTEEPTTAPSTESPTEEPSTENPSEEPTTKPQNPTEEPTDTDYRGNGLWISGVSKSGYTYIGEAVKPAIKVYNKDTLLSEKTDYTISYKNNKKAGKATIIVTGRGNYSGKETVNFDIHPADIGSQEVYATEFYVKIAKNAQKPIPELYYMGTKLKNNKDFSISYTNVSNIYSQIGEYSATVTGKGNYTGSRTLKLTAVEKIVKPKPVSIAKAVLNGFDKTFTYTGKSCRQECKLTLQTSEGEKNLVEGMDYTIKYANNIKAGTATVTFYGRNGYTGKLKRTYKILPYNIQEDNNAKVKYENNFNCVYAKGGSKPKPVITFDGEKMKEGVDYTLSYKNNKVISGDETPCVVVNGKGSFKGKILINFVITPQNLSKMTLVSSDKVYRNKAQIYTITPKLMDLDGRLLSAGKDFDQKSITYTYANEVVLENGISKKAGSKVENTDIIPVDTQICITLNCGNGGNYTGVFTGTYRIVKADIKSAKVIIPKQTYTGSEILLDKSQITINLSGDILKPEDFEIIHYENNVKKGNASATIQGKGNYGGTKTVKFTIGTRGFLWWWRK